MAFRFDGFLAITDEQWLDTFNLSFLAAVRTTRAAIPLLIERGGGNVVTIGSVNAFLPDPPVVDYSAAKAAVWNLSKSLSKEFGATQHPLQHHQPRAGGDPTLARGERRCGNGRARPWVSTSTPRATGSSPARAASRPDDSRSRPRSPTSRSCSPSNRAGNVTGADFLIDGGLIKTL